MNKRTTVLNVKLNDLGAIVLTEDNLEHLADGSMIEIDLTRYKNITRLFVTLHKEPQLLCPCKHDGYPYAQIIQLRQIEDPGFTLPQCNHPAQAS